MNHNYRITEKTLNTTKIEIMEEYDESGKGH